MMDIREMWRRLRNTVGGGRSDADLQAELRAHLALAADDAERRDEPGALRTARLRAGGLDQATEALRDQRGLPPVENVLRDVRQTCRSLRRQPGFSALAILSLALGIGT